MSFRTLAPFVSAALLGVGSSAFAGVDLQTTMTSPASPTVYVNGSYSVTVKNKGSTTANNVSLVVTLPLTHTSPSVYVMGTVGALTGCVQSGNTLSCAIGQLKNNKSKTVYFDLALPQSTGTLTVTATASTPAVVDTNPANNIASVTPVLAHPAIAFTPDQDIYNEHCTGTSLTSFFECVVSPGSIASHDTIFHLDGSIEFPGYPPDLAGTWSQPTPETLHFDYTEFGVVEMTFDGWAVDAACWEGVVVAGVYTIPYSVCLN